MVHIKLPNYLRVEHLILWAGPFLSFAQVTDPNQRKCQQTADFAGNCNHPLINRWLIVVPTDNISSSLG